MSSILQDKKGNLWLVPGGIAMFEKYTPVFYQTQMIKTV
jgi:hypothetical protein